MEFKGTKKDWYFFENETENGSFFKVTTTTESVCNITTRDGKRAEANAKLVSCAPEMLELLEEFTIDCDGYDLDYLVDKAKELIQKATTL